MKKIFLAFLIISALALPACAENFTIDTGAKSSDVFVPDSITVSADPNNPNSPDITEEFYRLKGDGYKFTTIADALSFANSISDYFTTKFPNISADLLSTDITSFPEVSITINNADSQNSSVIGDGALTMSNYGSVTKLDIAFASSVTPKKFYTPGTDSRHFIFDSNAEIKLSDLTIDGNDANGGIEISGGSVSFDKVTFSKSKSASDGGAVSITGGTVDFISCKFDNNNASNGGAVSVTGGEATFSNSVTFDNNIATSDGGAIYVTNGSVSLNGTATFKSMNSASNGGAVAVTGGSVNFANESTFEANTATTDGGVFYITGGSVTLESVSTFKSNTSTNNGGAIAVTGGSVNFASESTFEANTATTDGGAIYMTNGSISFNGTSTFKNSNSTANGGAIAVTGGSLNFSGESTFEANIASNDGGAVSITDGSANFMSCKFNKNNAASNGGAVSVTGGEATFSSSATFEKNTATVNGGALSITGGTVSIANGSKFTNNTATTNGGAILLDASGATLSLNGITFNNNTATEGAGGAIVVGTDGGTLTVEGCTFNNKNTAGTTGGAISVHGGSFTLDGSTAKNVFSDNEATTDGGAIYINGASGVTFSGTNDFTSNKAINNGGGAVYLAGNANLGDTLTFTGNIASGDGGAVYVNSGMATFNGTAEFNDNQATNGNGGAIFVNGSGNLSSGNAILSFTANYASKEAYEAGTNDPTSPNFPDAGYGGAICFVGTGNSTLGTVSFDINNAPVGGAVALTGNKNVSVSDIVATENGAWAGGAIYIGSGKLNFKSTANFENNTALDDGGAIYTTNNGGLQMGTSATFTKNQANTDNGDVGNGGAVYWGGNGSAFSNAFKTSGGVTFSENSTSDMASAGDGGAVYFATGTVTIDSSTNLSFNGNTALNSGGAIATEAGDINFNGITVSETNTATNGYGGLAYSHTGTIKFEDTSVSNQKAAYGGAVCAPKVEITNSSFDSNGDVAINKNGGAVYVLTNGTVTVTKSKFSDNTTSGSGGAIYAASAKIEINDSIFESNRSTSNGGAINSEGGETTIALTTFALNRSARYGGSIFSLGRLTIETSYFMSNTASCNGGAVYFNEHTTGEGFFQVSHSMFESNVALGAGNDSIMGGGALFLEPDYAKIDSCTFDSNAGVGGTSVRGGAVYLDVSQGTSPNENQIVNSTFVGNTVTGGTTDSMGGGLSVNGQVTIKSSAFTLGNSAETKGGGVYIASNGEITILGTLFVGNRTTANLGNDVCSDGTWSSSRGRGYNRVGVYGKGNVNTSWLSNPGGVGAGDRENSSWTSVTFYGSNELDEVLAENVYDDSKPPSIGSNITGTLTSGQIKLLTVMLSEDVNLALADRATNIIPFILRGSYPDYDQRGVSRERRTSDGTGIPYDIGPVLFGGEWSPDEPPVNPYTIAYIQISGAPNYLRRIGQTASLIAKVYYTNGRTNYGGTDDGEESVTWSVIRKSNCLKVNSKTGVITAMKATDSYYDGNESAGRITDYATVQVKSDRTPTAVATVNIRIVPELDYAELNTSPELKNSDAYQIVKDLITEFKEYNLGYGSNADISTYDYQKIIEEIFGVENAKSIVTASGTYNNVTVAGTESLTYVVNVSEDVQEGSVTPPLTYLCSFSSDELKSILGDTLYNSIMSTYLLAAMNIDSYTASRLFSVLTVKFEGRDGFEIPVLGSDGLLNVNEAMNEGALEVTTAGGGIDIKLNLMLANVETKDKTLKITGSGNSELNSAIIIPDGSNDGEIYGRIIFPQKDLTAVQTVSDEDEDTSNKTSGNNSQASDTTNKTSKANNSSSSSSGDGGGGGGCDSVRSEAGAPLAELGVRSVLFLALFLLGLVEFALLKFRRL